jgi:hypothetical protein
MLSLYWGTPNQLSIMVILTVLAGGGAFVGAVVAVGSAGFSVGLAASVGAGGWVAVAWAQAANTALAVPTPISFNISRRDNLLIFLSPSLFNHRIFINSTLDRGFLVIGIPPFRLV